jgi:dephospho-CoA kinase
VIDCPRTLQIARATARDGHSQSEVEAILAAQASRESRLTIADDIIDNSTTLDALQAQVDTLHSRYLTLAAATPTVSQTKSRALGSG